VHAGGGLAGRTSVDGENSPKSERNRPRTFPDRRKSPGRSLRVALAKPAKSAQASDFGNFSPSSRRISAKPPLTRTGVCRTPCRAFPGRAPREALPAHTLARLLSVLL